MIKLAHQVLHFFGGGKTNIRVEHAFVHAHIQLRRSLKSDINFNFSWPCRLLNHVSVFAHNDENPENVRLIHLKRNKREHDRTRWTTAYSVFQKSSSNPKTFRQCEAYIFSLNLSLDAHDVFRSMLFNILWRKYRGNRKINTHNNISFRIEFHPEIFFRNKKKIPFVFITLMGFSKTLNVQTFLNCYHSGTVFHGVETKMLTLRLIIFHAKIKTICFSSKIQFIANTVVLMMTVNNTKRHRLIYFVAISLIEPYFVAQHNHDESNELL